MLMKYWELFNFNKYSDNKFEITFSCPSNDKESLFIFDSIPFVLHAKSTKYQD